MRFVFEINHPAQVHLLRNLYYDLSKNGHFIRVFIKRDDAIIKLMNIYKIPYIYIGRKGVGLYGKLLSQIIFDLKLLLFVYFKRIKIGVGSSITNDHVSFLSCMHSIHLSDDDEEVVPLMNKYAYPFSNIILSPDCVKFNSYKLKNINYAGYHELAYLHPNRFEPDPSILSELDLDINSIFFVMRFNSFKAHHDFGAQGLSLEQKLRLIEILEPLGRVFITTENNIERELSKYQLKVSPEKTHSLLFYATIFIGDSQTMTSEAAVLGTPSIRCNSFVGKISYLEEEEHKYGLTFGYKPDEFHKLLLKLDEFIKIKNIKKLWEQRRQKMLSDKIDVSSFLQWFLENYPQSAQIMRENPDYQLRFK